jgi:hypothetical protein
MEIRKGVCSLLAAVTFWAAGGLTGAAEEKAFPKQLFQAGFELLQKPDLSRSFPAPAGTAPQDRTLRIYVWYPALPALHRDCKRRNPLRLV